MPVSKLNEYKYTFEAGSTIVHLHPEHIDRYVHFPLYLWEGCTPLPMATKVNILFFGTLLLVLSCNRALTDTSTPLSDEDVDSTTISNLKDLDTASKETNLSSDVTTPKLTESEENSDAGNSAEEDDDGWEEDETVNIVDQMRELREQGLQVPFEQRTTHINNTFDRLNGAWNVIDQYYLPSRETWVRLLGLVNSLNVPVSPECVASYYQGVGGFTNYDTWAYRCK